MKFWDFPDIGSVLFCRSLWMFSLKAYIKHVWNFSVNNRVNFKSKRLFDRKIFWKTMKSILRVLNMKILFLMLDVRYRFRHIYIKSPILFLMYKLLIRRDTKYLSVFSPNAGKYGPEKTPYLDTFHTVLLSAIFEIVFYKTSTDCCFWNIINENDY